MLIKRESDKKREDKTQEKREEAAEDIGRIKAVVIGIGRIDKRMHHIAFHADIAHGNKRLKRKESR